jgi:hypothetical protein
MFEFMDLEWVPRSLRATLRDILECGNSRPFREYYSWVAKETTLLTKEYLCDTVVELGAGTAPITRHLLERRDANNLTLVISDLNPDTERYKQIEERFAGRVNPVYSSVDFAEPQQWQSRPLLVLSATFHHIPPDLRLQVLKSLTESGHPVAIFEPLNNNLVSYLFVLLSIVPALLSPLRYIGRRGVVRRVVWCWVIPLAPLLFCWDGLVSCSREWTARDWHDAAVSLGLSVRQSATLLCHMTVLKKPDAGVE